MEVESSSTSDFTGIVLPPHWSVHTSIESSNKNGDSGYIYINNVTGDQTSEHPIKRYFNLVNRPDKACDTKISGLAHSSLQLDQSTPLSQQIKESVDLEEKNETLNDTSMSHLITKQLEYNKPGSGTASSFSPYEYHCQWKERDVFGRVSIYGLSIRHNPSDGRTMIRFDGILDGQWTFSALKGPYGAIEMHDLYVGAKVEIFGRHLTISSANGTAIEWINEEAKRLLKVQKKFCSMIESVGHKPIVRHFEDKPDINFNRDLAKSHGKTNLRKILMANARLGEQVAKLGIAHLFK